MAITATSLRKGQAIKYKGGDIGLLLEVEHRTPGKGAGFVQVIMRSFTSGKSKDIKFAASDKVDIVDTDRQKLEFSYSDPNGYYFMDTTSYETIEIPSKLLEESKDLLIENLQVEVIFIEGNPVTCELPPAVELEVKQAGEGIKGDTANNPTKAIILETGKEVQAPLFIKDGDRVKIDSRTGKYLGRA